MARPEHPQRWRSRLGRRILNAQLARIPPSPPGRRKTSLHERPRNHGKHINMCIRHTNFAYRNLAESPHPSGVGVSNRSRADGRSDPGSRAGHVAGMDRVGVGSIGGPKATPKKGEPARTHGVALSQGMGRIASQAQWHNGSRPLPGNQLDSGQPSRRLVIIPGGQRDVGPLRINRLHVTSKHEHFYLKNRPKTIGPCTRKAVT